MKDLVEKLNKIILHDAFFYVLTIIMVLFIFSFVTSSVTFVVKNLERLSGDEREIITTTRQPGERFNIEAFESLGL